MYWFILRPQRFGVKVALVNGDDILLVRHSYSGRWNLPGGGFRPNRESAEEAAAREIKEELGLIVERIVLLGSYDSSVEYKKDTVFCLTAEATLNIRPSAEIIETAWFPRSNVPDTVSTAVKKLLVLLNQQG
jgi:ADP-ribose pyrophosphatase YjhB (NUDIX family)